jgi:hypothetical protein
MTSCLAICQDVISNVVLLLLKKKETDRTRLSNGGSMGEMQNEETKFCRQKKFPWALVLLTLADFFIFLCMQLLPDGH